MIDWYYRIALLILSFQSFDILKYSSQWLTQEDINVKMILILNCLIMLLQILTCLLNIVKIIMTFQTHRWWFCFNLQMIRKLTYDITIEFHWFLQASMTKWLKDWKSDSWEQSLWLQIIFIFFFWISACLIL